MDLKFGTQKPRGLLNIGIITVIAVNTQTTMLVTNVVSKTSKKATKHAMNNE